MTKSITTLLHGIVDYAGLFPPAGLDMQAVVRNYAAYRSGNDSWMLGRLIVPVVGLDAFKSVAAQHLDIASTAPWRLSALVGADPSADFERIAAFNCRYKDEFAGAMRIDTVELKANTSEQIEAAMRALPTTLTPYFEIPLADQLDELIATIRYVKARAKIRTGGTTADLIPAPNDVLRFIHACVVAQVPFKATAGLHHPLRANYPLTYEGGCATGTMFGFLNVFLAAVLLHAGLSPDQAGLLLEESDPESFHFHNAEIQWRDHVVDTSTVAHVRQHLAISFGSCSFTEPVDDLKAMHLL